MKRVLFLDHVDRILGGAEINLVELLQANHSNSLWETLCATAPESPLRMALQSVPAIQHFDYEIASDFNRFRLVDRGNPMVRLLGGWKAIRKASRLITNLLGVIHPDVVVSCTNKDHLALAKALRAMPYPIPSVWWINDLFIPEFFNWPTRMIFAQAAKSGYHRLVGVSGAVGKSLRQLGIPASQIKTILNGIPWNTYSAEQRSEDRDWDPVRIGVVGRLTSWKGQHIALECLRLLRSRDVPCHLSIVGKAFNEDQEYEAELKRVAASSNLMNYVEFVPFQSNLRALFAQLDVLLHTSIKPEPFGRVIIEAMAARTAVVAANAGGVPEIIHDAEHGLLVAPGRAVAYADAVQRLSNDFALRSRLAVAGRERVKKHFLIERVTSQFRELFEE